MFLAPTPKGNLASTTFASPVKKKIRTSNKKYGAEYEKHIIFTETIGAGNTIVLYCQKSLSKHGGFISPLLKKSLQDDHNSPKNVFGVHAWDVASNTYLFLRKSHEEDKKTGMGFPAKNGIEYNRAAIFSYPSESVLENTQTEKDEIQLKTEKKFRDICFNILAEFCIKVPADESYVAWDPSHSLTKSTLKQRGTYKNYDEVFTDTCVANILSEFYIPDHISDNKVYQYLVDNQIANIFFSRRTNGKYSDFATGTFGFPKNSINSASDNDNEVEQN
jgi:hypothetical protein